MPSDTELIQMARERFGVSEVREGNLACLPFRGRWLLGVVGKVVSPVTVVLIGDACVLVRRGGDWFNLAPWQYRPGLGSLVGQSWATLAEARDAIRPFVRGEVQL